MSLTRLPENSGSWMRLLVGVLLLIGIVSLIRWVRTDSGIASGIPKEVLVNYVPSDFTFKLDDDFALAVLTHPVRYKDEFDKLVRNINEALLEHTAKRMGLPDSVQLKVLAAYEPHHNYLADLYFRDFMALSDSTAAMAELWYENQYTGASNLFLEVASKYTCFLTSHVISTALESTSGRLMGVGDDVQSPCGIALQEGLNPMMNRLKDRAAMLDFAESRELLQEKVERLIAELATLEIRDKKGLNKQLQTEVLGFKVSTTDITVTAISILKVGFDLNEQFELDLDTRNRIARIILPEPKILSHEVYPRLENLSIGWLRELQDEDLNNAFNALRAEFRREAMQEDVFERAKVQAEEIMKTLFAPMVMAIDPKIKIEVSFSSAAAVADRYERALND